MEQGSLANLFLPRGIRSWPSCLSDHASLPSLSGGKEDFFRTQAVLCLRSTNLFQSFLCTVTSRKYLLCFSIFSTLNGRWGLGGGGGPQRIIKKC